MNEETKGALRELVGSHIMGAAEFTTADAMEIWGISRGRAERKLVQLDIEGAVTVRKAHDPRIGKQVNAYKMV